jgi:hypothetical protein
MVYRLMLPLMAVAAVVAFLGAPLTAQARPDKNTHDGTFVKATSETEFVMADKGKEHSHTLAAGAKVIGPDGKEIKLADLKKGQKIRVTTKMGDLTIATKVEALKKGSD